MTPDRGPLLELPGAAGGRRVWWGRPWQLGTAAFWGETARSCEPPGGHALGRDLREELAACLLGGFGMPARVGTAAFEHVRRAGALAPGAATEDVLVGLLSQSLEVNGRRVRYRFPSQRGARLAAALAWLDGQSTPDGDDVSFRDWLTGAPGVGLKTASWIVRNHRDSDRVAIVDVHVRRAGLAAGILDPRWDVARDYRLMEGAFLSWAETERVRPSLLDACIWAVLSAGPSAARDVLGPCGPGGWPAAVWPV